MREPEPFNVIDEFLRIQMAPLRYLIALEEAKARKTRYDDFVRRYPGGYDMKTCEMAVRKPIGCFVLGWQGRIWEQNKHE